jgi:hypothetical protein
MACRGGCFGDRHALGSADDPHKRALSTPLGRCFLGNGPPPPFLRAVERPPGRSDERVRQSAQKANRGRERVSGEEHDGCCGQKADRRSAHYITGIVKAGKDTREAEHASSREEEGSHPLVDDGDGKRDPEGGDGVITGEGRLARRGHKQDRVLGVGDERSGSLPEVRDHLADQEPKSGGGHTGDRGDLPAVPGSGAVEEPQRNRRRREEGDGPRRDEVPDLLLDQGVATKEIVEEMEDGPVDPPTVPSRKTTQPS